jgi:hypothetical protein
VRRLLYALIGTVLVLIALSPAGHAHERALRSAGDRTAIRDVESALGGLSAGIAERVPIPTIGPAFGTAASDVAATAPLSWIAFVLAAAVLIGGAGLSRRDRAPPRRVHLLPA